jgi:adenylosuccinate lyase
MESRGIFLNLSPLDHRYSLSNPELFSALSARLGEEASIRACARVEVALLKALLRQAPRPELDPELSAALDRAAEEIDP